MSTSDHQANAERQRLIESEQDTVPWRQWGPYLSERQWGTVREDYSAHGNAWAYLPHDHARSRAYRWGEDGIAGICDDMQQLCLCLALWNGKDPILKERLFGLNNVEGNHGEDVKELYYYLDATPTNSYLKMLYKYPQRPFPYDQLLTVNRDRGLDQPEYELLDTGIFDDDAYFDVQVEYAKASADDMLVRINVLNRGSASARVSVIPQIFFRNTWSWTPGAPRPSLQLQGGVIAIDHERLGKFRLTASDRPTYLFCDNDTNVRRLYGKSNEPGYFKDALHEYVVHGDQGAVNPRQCGTKAGLLYESELPPGASSSVRLRLTRENHPAVTDPWRDFDALFAQRLGEADDFYAVVQQHITDPDQRLVQRQAYAGMIWSKQFFHYDVKVWLEGDPVQPRPPVERLHGRNSEWKNVDCSDIISMPDKWEFPWFASWDLAFHCVALAEIDAEFSKAQLVLLAREWYMQENGQLPAYEWAFGDVNPPVHAWATYRVFQIDRRLRRQTNAHDVGDRMFLERVFQKLMVNFTWWVNRKDRNGRNIFQGGYLGLDNIGCFDRSKPLPTGGYINQADGTAWMAMYCLGMLRISLELALHDAVYEDIATKFFEHFLAIASAINGVDDAEAGLWDEADQFYYDHLILADGHQVPLKIQSMVGLIPLLAVEVLDPETLAHLPNFSYRLEWYLRHRPEMASLISNWKINGCGDRRLLSLLRGHRMKALLRRMLDETQFLSEFGIRSVSKAHEKRPFRFYSDEQTYQVQYWPAESRDRVFGGNSNWRGPIWMPINYLIIESLQKFHHYYGDEFKVECPTRSGTYLSIAEVANELTRRLTRLFLRNSAGKRPVLTYHPKLASDPHFKDLVLFHEYFHGDTGRGVGASHQTGWSGLIAKLLQPRRPASASPTDAGTGTAVGGKSP